MKNPSTSGRVRFLVAGVIALAVGVPASLGATGYATKLVGFSHTTPTAAQYPPSKVTICHHTHSQKNPFVTITVSEHAVPAHLKHGDTIGPCTEQAAPVVPVVPGQQQKMLKAKKSKHVGKGSLQRQGKPAKQKVTGNRGNSAAHRPDRTSPTGQSTVHGKGQSATHARGPKQERGGNSNRGQGHGPGTRPEHGQGNGQGQGTGQGQGGTHGQGGGKGKGH